MEGKRQRTGPIEQQLPTPSKLVFESVLGASPEGQRMFLLCSDPLRSGEKAVVVATKPGWTEDELRAIVEADGNALVCTHRNDKFSRHDGPATTAVSIQLISPANDVDITKYAKERSVLVRETPELYEAATRPWAEALPVKQVGWVLAILNRQAEMDRLMYEDAHCMLVPDTKWDRTDVSSLYALALAKDRSLRSVRDLRGAHAQVLRELRDGVVACICAKYGVPANQLRAYLHYLPSFWHLHIHFNVLGCPTVGGGLNVGKALLLDDVIDQLERDPMHFARAAITYAIGSNDTLYAALRAAGLAE
ncbi:hypothetical protein KFE25_003043 [Diacronema lutheri]|uniref:Scavenger mRNA decapping enzyme n=1 Tax=Diacronema lutheri TaxID=2081491 RepID=A0A8J5X3K2_DIALT|nr:hypothetical protein KFE25_003043 [Diacronema lutheri]